MNIASFRFRNIFFEDGGPLRRVESGTRYLQNDRYNEAVAWLRDDLKDVSSLYRLGAPELRPDGAGTSKSALTARYMAVSEAIERWARSAVLADPGKRKRYGFDVDNSSNGLAAYPGVVAHSARKYAHREAIERQVLLLWWEGKISTRYIACPWPDVQAAELIHPFSTHKVVLIWQRYKPNSYSYGFGADTTIDKALLRSFIELDRTSRVIDEIHRTWPNFHSGMVDLVPGILEKRIAYYSHLDGLQKFQERMLQSSEMPAKSLDLETVYDGEIPGEWSKYAHVWRVLFKPPTLQFLENDPEYFFW